MNWEFKLCWVNYQFCYTDDYLYIMNNKSGKIIKPVNNGSGYLKVHLKDNSGKIKQIYYHRLLGQLYIANPYSKAEIDHIDRNKLNNKLSNLRWVNHNEQMYNLGIYKTNKSGVPNVYFHSRDNKWVYSKMINNKNYQYRFQTFDEAVAFKKNYKYDKMYNTIN